MQTQYQRPGKQSVQWQGDNLRHIEDLLDAFVITTSTSNGVLRIIGMGGLELEIQLGDTLILDGESLGIKPYTRKHPPAFVIWKGQNLDEFIEFLHGYKVTMAVAGTALLIHGGTKPIILTQGDRLYNHDGKIVVSIRGKDHADG